MRAALALAALTLSTPAFAGGVGAIVTGGFRTNTVYYYDAFAGMEQVAQSQATGLFGAGGEFVLGDRDDKILGVFRGYWLMEGPETDPALLTSRNPDGVVGAYRENPRHIGVGSVGIQWGFLGKPSGAQLNALGSVGSGFLTKDHQEFVQVEVGIGGSYTFARSLQAHVGVVGAMTMRKTLDFGVNGYGGIRYLFD